MTCKAEQESLEHARQMLQGRLAQLTINQRIKYDRLFPEAPSSLDHDQLMRRIDICDRNIGKDVEKSQ